MKCEELEQFFSTLNCVLFATLSSVCFKDLKFWGEGIYGVYGCLSALNHCSEDRWRHMLPWFKKIGLFFSIIDLHNVLETFGRKTIKHFVCFPCFNNRSPVNPKEIRRHWGQWKTGQNTWLMCNFLWIALFFQSKAGDMLFLKNLRTSF